MATCRTEAECYTLTNTVSVRELSRLISRLRHRQFGVFVTTSTYNPQAYEGVRLDDHPVVLICPRDIVEALPRTGGTLGIDRTVGADGNAVMEMLTPGPVARRPPAPPPVTVTEPA